MWFVPVLGVELTRLLDKQGLYQFDLFNPEVLPRDVSLLVSLFLYVLYSCILTASASSLSAAGLCGDSDGFWFPSSPSG